MRQPSSIEPFTPSPTVTLHPLLQSVLDNLDIEIDEELTRYRRQRRYPAGGITSGKQTLSQPTRATKTTESTKSFDLKFAQAQSAHPSPSSTAIGILNSTIQRSTPRSSIYADELPLQEHPKLDGLSTAPPGCRATYEATVPGESTNPVEPPAKLNSPPATVTAPPASIAELEPVARISSYAEQIDLSVYAPNETLQKLMQSEAQSNTPEDYLSSSEELLRSIAEEDVELRADREPNSMLETLLTPLGIGSMLLLLLSSTTLGFMIMNPSSLGWWTTSQSSTPATANSTPETQSATAPSPDLASEEFVDLGLDTLSTLPKPARVNSTSTKAKTAPKPTTASRTALTQSAARSTETPTPENLPAAPAPQISLSTVVVPAEPPIVAAPSNEPTYQPVAPAPLPPQVPVSPEPISATPPSIETVPALVPAPTIATAPTSSTPSNPANYYYVVTDYSGDSSLQEARGAVPDAYVRNLPSEGAKVQLGAFNDEMKAQELLQELENQGIQAEVYQP